MTDSISHGPGGDRLATGYRHWRYADSLKAFGTPRWLPAAGGWILERTVPGTDWLDGISCYPIMCCADWSSIHTDVEELATRLISLTVVTDPFGPQDVSALQRSFPDLLRPFKFHVVVDLRKPLGEAVSSGHRAHIRRASRRVEVSICPDPAAFAGDWHTLYQTLIRRHSVTGIRAFSLESFRTQLQVPGTVILTARHSGELVGAKIYFVQAGTVYYHLGASTDAGYRHGASYALDWASLEYFHGKAEWLDLGAGAGIADAEATDGLTRYKHGWSNDRRMVFLGGRIFDAGKYRELAVTKGAGGTTYFPAYRSGEFS